MSEDMQEIKVIENTEVAPLQPSEDTTTNMIQYAMQHGNIDMVKQLLDMQNSEIARKAKIEFQKDFAEMQNEMPRVITKHKNTQTSSNYAKIEDINEQVMPVLKEYGFGVSFKIVNQDKESVTVRASLLHKSGHEESTEFYMPYDDKGIAGKVNKTQVHAIGSTVSYAKRYAMCMLLNISTGQDNDGQKVGALINDDQLDVLSQLIDCEEIDKPKFMKFYKIRSLGELPASKYEIVLKTVKETIAKSRNKNNENT